MPDSNIIVLSRARAYYSSARARVRDRGFKNDRAAADMSCCPPESLPSLASNPVAGLSGGKGTVGGVDCYISGSGTTSAVIIFSDVWGWDSGRIRELADELAAEGHLVVIPKLLQPALEGGTDGDGLPPDFDLGARGADFGPWVTAVPWSKLEPQVNALLDEINGRGISKIGCMGTCWGAWATFQTSATGRIACGVNCHPSVGLEAMFGGDDIQLADTVQCPMMMLPASGDAENTKPGGEMNKLFDTKPFGADCVYQEFPEMEHGWVPRGDTSDETVARDVKAAMALAKGYFAKFLAGDASL